MAEKILNTRILMKVDTLENWSTSTLKLKNGELAFATVAASAGTGLEEPVVMVKIGTAEEKTFAELPWAFHAKASDVLSACKTEAGLKAFVNGVIADAGIASSSAMEALAGKVTTAEGKITALENELNTAETGLKARMTAAEGAIAALDDLVGDKKVATQISEAIDALKLGETYAAKALEKTVADHVADTVAHVTSDDKIKWNNALQAADVVTGSANGTISVKGSDVAVKGLGSAAFTDSTAYDASGSAAAAESAAKAYAKEYADGLAGNYDAKGAAAAAQSAAETYAKNYADGLAGNYDAAGSAAAAEAAAKKHADDELTRLVGDKTVGTQITEAITGLDLANTYDAKGAAAAAETAAKSHADGLNTAMNTRVEALEAIDHTHTFVESELNLIKAGDVAKWNAAEQNAKDYADAEDAKIESRVGALEAKFTGDDSVADQIADAVAAEAALREEEDGKLQDAIDAIEADYLKASDKTELQNAINALDELVGDEKVSEAIAAEAKAREDADAELAADIKAISDDYLKAADKTELTNAIATAKQEAIATVLGEGTDKDFDTLKEVADWILSDTTGAAALQTDVAAIKADYLKAADKTELEGKITTAQNAADKAQGEVDALEEVVATKAAQSDLNTLAGRVTTIENEHNAEATGLKARLAQAESDITALEGKVGDKTVNEQIVAVTDPLTARVVELEKVDHEHANKELLDTYTQTEADLADAVAKKHSHANAAELDKFVDGDKAKLDAAVQTVTAGTGLTATKTGTDVAIAFDDSVTFIFDCGDSKN